MITCFFVKSSDHRRENVANNSHRRWRDESLENLVVGELMVLSTESA